MRITTVDELLREIARAAEEERGVNTTVLNTATEAEAEEQLAPLELTLKKFANQLAADGQQVFASTTLIKPVGKVMEQAQAYMVTAVTVPAGSVKTILEMVNNAEDPLEEYLRLFRASIETVLVLRQIDELAGKLVDEALGR